MRQKITKPNCNYVTSFEKVMRKLLMKLTPDILIIKTANNKTANNEAWLYDYFESGKCRITVLNHGHYLGKEDSLKDKFKMVKERGIVLVWLKNFSHYTINFVRFNHDIIITLMVCVVKYKLRIKTLYNFGFSYSL